MTKTPTEELSEDTFNAAWNEFDRINFGNPSGTLKLALRGALKVALSRPAPAPGPKCPKCPKCRYYIAHDGKWDMGCHEENCRYSTRPSRYIDPGPKEEGK